MLSKDISIKRILFFSTLVVPFFCLGQQTERKFKHIKAVEKETNGKWSSYYQNKSGKIFGRDSVEYYDNTADCESEGFIRFRDRKTDKAGIFNRYGRVVIPADYDYLLRVHNGMVMSLKGAKKVVEFKDDEHPWWKGGIKQLLDTNNRVLVENFPDSLDLNFYSLKISGTKSNDSTRVSFKGTNGKYYSFVDFNKEFHQWLKINILDSCTKENLLKVSHKTIAHWIKDKGWIHDEKDSFINRNYDLIKEKLLQLNKPGCDYFISKEGLNDQIFSSEEFNKYFTDCGESKDWIYPVIGIYINNPPKNNPEQDSFDFLRTENGYELISVTIRKGELK